MLNHWLKNALVARKMTQRALSDALTQKLGRSIDYAAVNKMVSGLRRISVDELVAAADILGVQPPLSEGRRQIPIVGYIGAGAEVIPFDDHSQGGGFDEVDPLPEHAVAVIVRGNSMYPRYIEGERILYVQDGATPRDLLGQECVVKLSDGRMLIKILRKGSKKTLFNLESWNAEPLEDQRIDWAAPVLWRGRR